MTEKTIGDLGLKELTTNLHNFRHHDSVSISFPHKVAGFLKLIKSALLPFFIRAEIVEDKLKIFARRPKHDLILTTIEIVVVNLDQTIIDKNVSVDDVEHAAQLDVFIHGVHESNWVEVVNTTVLLYYEAPFNELASKLV